MKNLSWRTLAILVFVGAIGAAFLSAIYSGAQWVFSGEGAIVFLLTIIVSLVLYQLVLADAFAFQVASFRSQKNLARAHRAANTCHWESDADGQIRWSSSAWDFFEAPPPANDTTWVADDFMTAFALHRKKAIETGRSTLVFKACTPGRGNVWIKESVEFSKNEGLVGILQDVSDAKHAEKQMSLSANVYKSMGDGVVVTTTDGVIVDINPAMERISLYSREEVIGKRPAIFRSGLQSSDFYDEMWRNLSVAGRWSGDIKNKRKNGDAYIQNTLIEAVVNDFGEVEYYVAVCRDVTRERQVEQRLTEIAYYDDLTGLANKRLFSEKTESLLESCRPGQKVAVLIVDLDNLFAINGNHGHAVGDFVIKSIGDRISKQWGATSVISRFGGDEFCIACLVQSLEALDLLASDLLAAISRPISVPLSCGSASLAEVCVTGSIGATIYPDDKVSADTLIRHAGHAMHAAKTKGGDQYCMFSTEDDRIAHRHHEIIRSIEVAMSAGDILPFYQPKVDIRTGITVGAEALTRWISNGHPVPPSEFIENIERCSGSLPTRFTLYMMDVIARDVRSWMDEGLCFPVSINVFPSNLRDPDFCENMKLTIERHGIPASVIEMEIVESSDVGDRTQASLSMSRLRNMGFKLSIDDFGTGYSSLDYLRKLPVETLKIDQSFVINMMNSADDEKIVDAVIQLAKSLSFSVVAEGIEDAATERRLAEMGCNIGQGYYYSKPIPSEQFRAWVINNQGVGVLARRQSA